MTTTQTPTIAASPTLPTSTLSLPSGFSASASDTLAEQIQLPGQIENLSLLLESPITGSLADLAANTSVQHSRDDHTAEEI